jgi:hypothetical protein
VGTRSAARGGGNSLTSEPPKTTLSTQAEAGIDKNLVSQKPPFKAAPASGFAGTGVQIDRETEPKHPFISRRRHKPAADTAPKAADTRIFLARGRAMLKISFDRLLRDRVRIPA